MNIFARCSQLVAHGKIFNHRNNAVLPMVKEKKLINRNRLNNYERRNYQWYQIPSR